MKKGINYWSFPGGLEGTLDPFKAVHLAKDHRFEAIEICIGDAGSAFGIDATESKCRDLVGHATELGVAIETTASGLYWSRSLADADPSARAQATDDLKKMLQISSWLGAKTHLTIPGAVDVFFLPERTVQFHTEVIEFARQGIAEVLPVAQSVGVRIGIENVWNRIFTSPTELSIFIDQFESPFVGSYFDVGNVMPFGYPEQWIKILGKRIVGIHLKDFRRAVGTAEGFVDLLEGDVNWPEVMAAIREIGFSGPVVAEMIPGYRHHPMVRIANTSNAMDAILH